MTTPSGAYVAPPAQRPPWVLVVRLPDDVPPVAADLSSLPEGSEVTAFCSDASETVLSLAGALIAGERAEAALFASGDEVSP